MRLGARELQAASAGSSKGFGRGRAGSNSSSESHSREESGGSGGSSGCSGGSSGGSGGGRGPGGARARNNGAVAGSNGGGVDGVGVGTGAGDENSDHSGEGVDDDSINRSSLLVGQRGRSQMLQARRSAMIPEGGGGGGVGGVGTAGGVNDDGGEGDGDGDGRGEYKLGEGSDGLSMDNSNHLMASEDSDSERGYEEGGSASDDLVGSRYIHNYGDLSDTAGAGGAEAWARVRGRGRISRHHPRIRPTHERGASPASTPPRREVSRVASAEDSGLGGVEFLSSPGGTGCLLDAFCSPASENTAAGAEMTQASE